tara:strand:+ start:42198 stop:42335 length:138 start_codon:yes stop_codon:yes gene_type:complete
MQKVSRGNQNFGDAARSTAGLRGRKAPAHIRVGCAATASGVGWLK